jgi:indolepyruvate ferredoxin oxidoreductase
MMRAFAVLARLRHYRGTMLDVFNRSAERRRERALVGEYEAVVDEILGALALHNHALAVEIATIPEEIRGFGPVKDRHIGAAKQREAQLLAAFRVARPRAPSILDRLPVVSDRG